MPEIVGAAIVFSLPAAGRAERIMDELGRMGVAIEWSVATSGSRLKVTGEVWCLVSRNLYHLESLYVRPGQFYSGRAQERISRRVLRMETRAALHKEGEGNG